ncbi:50S ribosomal protein L29 [bacterium]|nr:50S ribosomal protein L29 [bacterium]MBU0899837.1 50S ribosomal protein L29 [bacterium]MBU1153623.1 50S ribosomal protein L29 [bacterium]MBU1782503.1 50S ribosomal protein L29 [bacterium]MBU2600260.1 50S ribosomal protein L29 [bacterium]
MKFKELRELSLEELKQKKVDLKEEFLNLRVQSSSKKLDNPLRMRLVKRMIAAVNTKLRENSIK